MIGKQTPRKAVKELRARSKEEDFIEVAKKLRLFKERLTIHLIEVDRISPPKDTGKPKNLDSLSASIRRYGLLEPLTVRRVCPDESPLGGVYSLLSGSGRLAALKNLGVKQAPCYIFDLPAAQADAAIASKIIATRPRDLFEIAKTAVDFQISTNKSDEETARALCIPRERLRALKYCASLDEAERALCRRLCFPDQLILSIARLPADERAGAIAECATCLRQLISTYQSSEGQQRNVYLSVLPFYNSIDRLIAQMRSAGFAAHADKAEEEDEYIVTIRLPKHSAHMIAPDVKKSG